MSRGGDVEITLDALEANSHDDRRSRPLPEGVRGRAEKLWTVRQCPPMPEYIAVDIKTSEMSVPMGSDVRSVALRGQAMGKARYGVEKIKEWGASLPFCEVAEQARINALTEASGIPLDDVGLTIVDSGDAVAMALGGDWSGIVQASAEALHTGRWKNLRATFKHVLPADVLDQLDMLMDYGTSTYKHAIARNACTWEMASYFAQLLEGHSEAGAGKAWADAMWGQGEEQGEGEGDKEGEAEGPPPRGRKPGIEGGGEIGDLGRDPLEPLRENLSNKGTNEWGEMKIIYNPLERNIAGRWARRRIPHEEGAIPRSMHRMPVDGRVFDYRVHKHGGTVLIDCSGSMSLRPEEIDEIIACAPGAVIATYCGQGKQGELRLVAMGGRVVAREHLTSVWGGNVVDGPALKWMLREREPRLWVCDGYVTGHGDVYAGNLAHEALALATAGRVIMVYNVAEAIEFLGRRSGVSEGDRRKQLERLKAHR